jgi:hypothetical protein
LFLHLKNFDKKKISALTEKKCSNNTGSYFFTEKLDKLSIEICPSKCDGNCFYGNKTTRFRFDQVFITTQLTTFAITQRCSNCKAGYALSYYSECVACSSNCASCQYENSTGVISKANTIYESSNSDGTVDYETLYGVSSKCLACKGGYYLKENACLSCPANCGACVFDSKINNVKCLRCLEGFGVKYDGSCAACPTNCLSCLYGNSTFNFTISEQSPILTESEALNYNLNLRCKMCSENYTVSLTYQCVACSTVSNCRYCHYMNSQKNIIQYDILNAIDTTGFSLVCTSCLSPYRLDKETLSCTTECTNQLSCSSCYKESSSSTETCTVCFFGYYLDYPNKGFINTSCTLCAMCVNGCYADYKGSNLTDLLMRDNYALKLDDPRFRGFTMKCNTEDGTYSTSASCSSLPCIKCGGPQLNPVCVRCQENIQYWQMTLFTTGFNATWDFYSKTFKDRLIRMNNNLTVSYGINTTTNQ